MWSDDLKTSTKVFIKQIEPIFLSVYGGELLHMETVQDSKFAKSLDMLSGIDSWHISNGNIRGVASRVQWGNPNNKSYPYNTFTIRQARDTGARTEYAKRKFCIESSDGWIYPHLAVQAYTDLEYNLISFAIVKTINLINAIDNGLCSIKRTTNASFYIVDWSINLCEAIYVNNQIFVAGNKFVNVTKESSKKIGELAKLLTLMD